MTGDLAAVVPTLLPLAIADPAAALRGAEAVLGTSSDAYELSVAHQTAAIVLRDRGSIPPALDHGFAALRSAQHVSEQRRADCLATLGTTLVYAGQTGEGLKRLDEAARLTAPGDLPRLLVRRGNVLIMLARYRDAVADLTQALAGSHRDGDILWEGRALNNRFDAYLALGETDLAEGDAVRAERLLSSLGQDYEANQALHNRALAAHQRGDLPTALRLLDEATERYTDLDNVRHDLHIDRVQTLLTAGLTDEARTLGTRTLADDLAPVRRAELLLALAQAALAQGDNATAWLRAQEAAQLFSDQLRTAWADRAHLVALRARFVEWRPEELPWMADQAGSLRTAHAPDSARLLAQGRRLVSSMRANRSRDLPLALLLTGRLAHADGDDEAARGYLHEAATSRRAGSPLARAAGWQAAAELAHYRRDRRALWAACRSGLDAVDEHRSILGDLELRTLASGHGLEFAELAIAEALRSGRPRALFWWTERWRAAALRGPVKQPDDPVLRRDLAALREVGRRIDTLGDDDPAGDALSLERRRLEESIRRAHRHAVATGGPSSRPAGLDLGRVFAALGADTALVTLIHHAGELHRLTLFRGRVRHTIVGSHADAKREADFARLALRRAAHGRRVDLSSAAQALEHALLGDGRGPWNAASRVVVIPQAELLTAPWGLLPALRGRVVSVSPSVTQWVAAEEDGVPVGRHVALVTGPGLTTREVEVADLGRLHSAVRVLHPEEATASATLEALDSAVLGHIAAHGVFRAEAPLFSALMLRDGPLIVHDFRQLERPPASLVLSACDSGGAAPIGSFEALGLVSTLLGMGTRSLLAAVVPVNDQATLSVMAEVHKVVARGGTIAEGWLAARQAGADDPLLAATASSFTAWGA